MKFRYFILVILIGFTLKSFSQHTKTDANIVGHVTSGSDHLPFVNIFLKGTTIGTTTDETGHFQLINLPEGKYTLRSQIIGYAPQEKEIELRANKTLEVKFDMKEDALGLEELVVTGDRNERSRKESVIAINTITPKLFEITQSVTISDGLNFCPGIRTENNCQNCGFNQVRMNGMEGPYSQILIDGRAIFSGLASVYGLELFPSSMIQRIEVVKGGGSVLYGSNAIAGTINLIIDEPVKNSFQFGVTGGSVGMGVKSSGPPASEYTATMNGSIVSNDHQSGLSLFGFYRNRQPFDANDDGFSEISKLCNLTSGSRLYHRFGTRSKLTGDFFVIHEERRGGNKFDLPPHETDITEGITHNILNGALSSQTYFNKQDVLSVYVSGQYIDRDSYYGANQSLKDYGHTTDFTWVAGAQYLAKFNNSSLTTGIENQNSSLNDIKLGYPDYEHALISKDSIISIPHVGNTVIADQSINTVGIFAQYEQKWKIITGSVGLRYDQYTVNDHEGDSDLNTTGVLIPKLSFKVDISENFHARVSYAQGYRAPQIFDEDLHIETSGSRQVIHVNAPGLKQETSHSAMISFDFHKSWGKTAIDFQTEGFYTLLQNPFTIEYSAPDSTGIVVYTRYNSDKGAMVYGLNLQADIATVKHITLTSGFTWQQSRYEAAQAFEEKKFFRTPSTYGFLTINWGPFRHSSISSSLNYTGSMLVPYFGPDQSDPEQGELRSSGIFFDWGVKISYIIPINGASLQLIGGMKNILNSYQNDFDQGIDRDPGYIYGPMFPRTIYFGISFRNTL
ncbi:MAG: TonB-dependent receptor [Bacteroidales bacterium]|nr:TonB-dependent receptor [Bacteroidales bacterium]